MAWARRRVGAAVLAAALGGAGGVVCGTAAAQPFLPLGETPAVVTLDQDRLFAESAFGRRVTAAVQEAARQLGTENRAFEAMLAEEERRLTELRATRTPEDFRALADAFDARVEEIRSRQEGRNRAIAGFRDAEQQRFFEAALPVVTRFLVETGAVAVLDRRAIILAIEDIDVTDRVLERLDVDLGDGAADAPPVFADARPAAEAPAGAPGFPLPDGAAEGFPPANGFPPADPLTAEPLTPEPLTPEPLTPEPLPLPGAPAAPPATGDAPAAGGPPAALPVPQPD